MVFNAWFERFMELQDAAAVSDLRGRFRAKQGGQFYGAFWELYVHELFARLGFDINVHPESERGTRPDFDLCREGKRMYLEAVMPTPGLSERDEPGSVETVIEHVTDAFRPDWRLKLRSVTAGKQMPRKVTVQKAVTEWLDSLDVNDHWKGDLASSKRPDVDLAVGDGWVIRLTALPMPPENRGRESMPMIALGRSSGGYPEALGPAILPLLTEKANKYGDLDAPLVIAVWVMDLMSDSGTLPLALFGRSLSLEVGVQRTGLAPLGDSPKALWSPHARHRGRASAVLAADSFSFNYPSVSRVLPRLWINPWSDRPVEVDLPFATSRVSENGTTVDNRPGETSAADLFGLPEDWPGRPFQKSG